MEMECVVKAKRFLTVGPKFHFVERGGGGGGGGGKILKGKQL